MNHKTITSSSQDSELTQKILLSRFHWLFLLTAGAVLLLVASVVFQLIFLHRLSNRVELLEWNAQLKDVKWLGSTVFPNSNVIQFLDNGFSIEFEQVIYEPTGLHLTGFFGNPKSLTIRGARLRFSARRNASLEDYPKGSNEAIGDFKVLRSPEEIGIAETPAIDTILSGTRARFDVTIPNVRYTKDGLMLYVSLNNERYSYIH